MNVAEVLREQALLRPHAPAIIDGRGTRRAISFAELERASARAAMFLSRQGLGPGDEVLVFQPMSQELYIVLIALFRLGCVAMFLDPSAGRGHIEACCALSPPRALIASSKAHLLRLVSPALRRIPLQICIGWRVPGATSWRRAAQAPARDEIWNCEPHSPALLTFTSGSTGEPKAALRTHGFLLAQHEALAGTMKLSPGALDLTTLPIFLLSNLASGVASLIPDADLRRPGSIDAARLWAQIQKERPSSVGASPALLERLAEHAEAHNQKLDCIAHVFTGGAPVFPRLLRRLRAMAPQARVEAVYGSTEAEPIAHVALEDISDGDMRAMQEGGGLLAGAPVGCIDLRILPDGWGKPIAPMSAEDFALKYLQAGQRGEIVVSGAHVLPGYLHGRGDEETKFEVDGARWHRTGDSGYLDERGRLWLTGRCTARITDSHGTLYPFAVECAALERSGVRRAAVVQHRGRRLLVVELRQPQDEAQRESLRQELAWAHIAEIRVLQQIPVDKRHNAKIDYPELERILNR